MNYGVVALEVCSRLQWEWVYRLSTVVALVSKMRPIVMEPTGSWWWNLGLSWVWLSLLGSSWTVRRRTVTVPWDWHRVGKGCLQIQIQGHKLLTFLVAECSKQVYPRKSPSFENRHQKLMDQSVVSVSPGCDKLSTWARLNIKDRLSRYGDSHVKDKTAGRTSYL